MPTDTLKKVKNKVAVFADLAAGTGKFDADPVVAPNGGKFIAGAIGRISPDKGFDAWSIDENKNLKQDNVGY